MKSISKYMHHRSNHRNIVMRTILKMNTLWESNIIFLEGKQRKMYISHSSPPLICGLQPAAGRALSTGATVDSRQRITICLQSVLCVIWAARSGPGVSEWSVLPLSSTKQACSLSCLLLLGGRGLGSSAQPAVHHQPQYKENIPLFFRFIYTWWCWIQFFWSTTQ